MCGPDFLHFFTLISHIIDKSSISGSFEDLMTTEAIVCKGAPAPILLRHPPLALRLPSLSLLSCPLSSLPSSLIQLPFPSFLFHPFLSILDSSPTFMEPPSTQVLRTNLPSS